MPNPLGLWWRQPPHAIRKGKYAPYRGKGVRPVTIKADVLAPTGKRTERYAPAGEPELLNAVLDVSQGRLKPVEFANRFGLLGYNWIVPRENCCKGGDPLGWFVAHAHTLYVLAGLIRAVGLAKKSPTFREGFAAYLAEELPLGPYALGGQVVRCRFRSRTDSPVSVANGILRYLLNANLGDTGRRLQLTGHGFRSVFTFKALVQVIYWQLADQLGGRSIRRCRECGRVFVSPNPRAQFCPPEGGKKISPCKSRWNVRRFRKRIERKGRKKR